MNPITLRYTDFLSGDDFIYEHRLPRHIMYLRDIVEGNGLDQTYTPWQRLKQVQEYKPLVYSDIYRSPAASAAAYARKTGVAKPGYSGHNYGISVDVAVDESLKRNSINYDDLCALMIAFGWTPFQGITGPFKRGKEDWHFNFAGDIGHYRSGASVATSWIDTNIDFDTDLASIQSMLSKLKFFHGEADGQESSELTEAVHKFKSAWIPSRFFTNDKLDDLTIRTINVVSADCLDAEGNLII